MATYYVATYGSNSNNGTSAATPWLSISFAIGAASGTNPGLAAGDTVWVAPGTYRETLAAALQYLGGNGTAGSPITIKGDPLATQAWTATSAGVIRWTVFPTDITNPSGAAYAQLIATSKNYINWESLYFDTWVSGYAINLTTCQGWTFTKCVFSAVQLNCQIFSMTNTAGTPFDFTLDRCVLLGGQCLTVSCARHSSTYDVNINIKDCIFVGCPTTAQALVFTQSGSGSDGNGVKIYNSHFQGFDSQTIYVSSTNTTHNSIVKNCVLIRGNIFGGTTGAVVQTYNRLINVSLQNTATSVTTVTTGSAGLSLGYERINGLTGNDLFAPYPNSPNIAFGNSTGAPTVDLYSATWAGNPDAGAVQKLAATGSYLPTERNASTITIAPASTSQSIELYLGATGLTFATSGLAAYYVRNREAPTPITLVTQTATGAWASGGFAEISSSLVPGVYRLDVPNAAFAAGASDVTIVVRGASGTNGAVLTVTLSSGGLTAAQTASAVWGASVAGYSGASTFGGIVTETSSVVNGIDGEVQDIPSNVWDELKANHTIPNTFGDYLDTKVSTGADTSRIQLRQGPFLIKQNATEGLITEVNQFLSTVPNMEIVLIDSSGGAVSVAGSTLVLRVRNQAGTAVVNNVTPTVAYADGGVIRWTPNLSWNALSVTIPGTYRIIVERTMGTTTTTFGPFLVQLSSG
jgi:hypothetical protein